MFKKKSAFSALLVSAMLTVAGCSGSHNASSDTGSADEPLTLNVGHTLAPDSHYNAVFEKMSEIVEEKSEGTIKMDIFPQSQLGGEVQMIQAARKGSIDLFVTAQAPLTTTIKEYSMFDLPYLFDSVEQANQVLASPVGDEFLGMLDKHGLVGVGWLSVMERNVFSSKSIDTVEDMAGFKIRVMQSPGYVAAYESLGAQPTPMAYSEVYLSLQQGVVDGADTSPDQFVMDKFVEVADYYNKTKVHYLPALLIASKSKWDSFSEEQRTILQEAADEALAYGIEYYEKSYEDSIQAMQDAGVEVVETDISGLKEASQPVTESLVSDIPDGEALLKKIEEAKK